MPTKPTTDLFQPQLFLDDHWVADFDRVHRVWHEARKYRHPVLVADEPWEQHCPTAYGSVLHWQGAYHMWYMTWSRVYHAVIAYARSNDGIHWEKPKLGLHEVNGTTNNNVVFTSEAFPNGLIDDLTVLFDPQDDRWPLKALFWDSGPRDARTRRAQRTHGIWLARSPNGIQWEKSGCVLPRWGDRFNALPVKHDGRWVLLGREPGMRDQGRGRIVSLTTSRDLRRWSKPRVVITADLDDPAYLEIYSATPFAYGDLFLGAIERMHMVPDVLDPELTWSRDGGATWHRPSGRPTFITRGPRGAFDSDWVALTASQPIYHEPSRSLWFYYSGRSTGHDSPHPYPEGGIGLATLRVDGFCSLRAMEVPGFFLTPSMTWPNGDLVLNADTRRDQRSHPGNLAVGEVRVEVRDAHNGPIRGYTLGDCVPIQGNSGTRFATGTFRVVWGKAKSLRRLRGRRIRLRFQMRDAHLYSFRANDGAGAGVLNVPSAGR